MSKNVVIIDDEKPITELFSEILTMSGFNVVGTGHDGNDAIRLFTELEPDMVFMDVHMPNCDGVEALTKIKNIDSDSKVIMVTSDTSSDLEAKLNDVGATAIIFKPFSLEKIDSVLKKIPTTKTMIIQ